MANAVPAAETLSEFAASLRYEDIPEHVRQVLKQCLIDSVACASFGAMFPWSKQIARVAAPSGHPGRCRFPGAPDDGLAARPAALTLGAFAHAFEQDSLRRPSGGVHAGATVMLPAFAVAQETGAGGKALITAMAAGVEVMFRIGAATLHTPEKKGFHAPGLTGPFGAAIAAGKLLNGDAGQLLQAMAIAGSMASGLLAFAHAGNGGMIKRLHLGRAAEGGVLAAILAMEGLQGPTTVLDGKFGLLDAFCSESDPSLLTMGLGQTWQAETICFKKYPCHITGHAPLEAMARLRADAGFDPGDIVRIEVAGDGEIVSHHNIPAPSDIMLAQYSIPFCLALSLYYDAADPASFNDTVLSDGNVLTLARKVELRKRANRSPAAKGWGVNLAVQLRDGRFLETTVEDFPGVPEMPFTREQMEAKFNLLTKSQSRPDRLLATLQHFESVADVGEISWTYADKSM